MLEWAAQGGGGVTIPGPADVLRDMLQWGNNGGRWMVGLDDIRGLFQPWWFYDYMNSKPSQPRLLEVFCMHFLLTNDHPPVI